MRDLLDGESVEVQGSAARPYVLKNVGGVYSCSCPAWRNQSLSIDRRTCKHLRQLKGNDAEAARVGTALTAPAVSKSAVKAPPLLLAETWDGETDPKGWHLSEKLDGVRGYWDGRRFLSRQGHVYHAPPWFTEGLPLVPLDGELWIGRKQFQRTVSIARRQDAMPSWRDVRFVIFDVLGEDTPFEARLELIRHVIDICRPPYAVAHPHIRCTGKKHLHEELQSVESLGGEGLMLRQPGSRYFHGRSPTLLKVKSFKDAEAIVVGHEPGNGRHRGRLGSLLVETEKGVRFAVGTGLSDAERSCPPGVGQVIRYRFQELTDAGVPRFPVYAGMRFDSDFPR